jgi:hypothetical protein
MTREEFMQEIDQRVDEAIAAGMLASGTDELIEESILDELETTQMPKSTGAILVGLLVIFGMRRREFLSCHHAH